MMIIDWMHLFLNYITNFLIVLLELMGVFVIAITAFHGLHNFLKKDPKIRLKLLEGLSTALSFKLGSEILRTVIVREMNEVFFIGAIILLRAGLTFLIHWEIHSEQRH